MISKDFSLDHNRLELSSDFYDFLSFLENRLKKNVGVTGNCFKVSHWLKDFVNDFFKVEYALITIGHVIHNNVKEFYQPMDIRLKQLELGQANLPINLHCWLTLPGGIILDPTYLSTKYQGMDGKILLRGFEDMPQDFFFYPEFIGSEYLIRTGIPIDI
ncbi:hypothetical protein [Acinetobacter pittii]|uniref:hypothetical protein n=1 Tax=Acinetobacter pittii TaxID=48296 RepID=UPI003260FE6B